MSTFPQDFRKTVDNCSSPFAVHSFKDALIRDINAPPYPLRAANLLHHEVRHIGARDLATIPWQSAASAAHCARCDATGHFKTIR
jgi:hypothetical protein